MNKEREEEKQSRDNSHKTEESRESCRRVPSGGSENGFSTGTKYERDGENEIFKSSFNVSNQYTIHENSRQGSGIFPLPEASPMKYNFSNNLQVSPIVENKSAAGILMTPQRMNLHDLSNFGGTTPHIPFDFKDMKMDSPFQANIQGLKHNEKSSSFKRIRINNFPNEIFGRNINFDNTVGMNSCNDTEYFSKKGDYLGMKNCNSNNNTNINNSSNIRHNNFFQNTTQQRRNFNYKMSFSSENDSSDMSDDDEEESVGKEKSSILSMNKNSKLIKHENEQFTFPSSQPKKLCCTCTKSRCLKKYCECFANKEYCAGCECVNCYNLPKFREMVKRSLEFACGKKDNDEDSANESQKSELTCNCTKSNCTKKYCECYKAGEGCKELCRCINCENNKELLTIQKKKEVVSEVEREKRKIFRNPLNFIIEGTSVYIYNEDISITQRKEIPNKKDLNINNVNNVNNVNNLSNPSNSMNLNNLNNLNIINQNEKELTKDSQSRKNSKIFQVQANLESASKIRNFNFNSNETPKLSNKKRRRITKDEDNTNSNVKSASTHFQTPIFTTTTSEKTTGNKKKVNLDKHIVKNLDKIY